MESVNTLLVWICSLAALGVGDRLLTQLIAAAPMDAEIRRITAMLVHFMFAVFAVQISLPHISRILGRVSGAH